MRQRVYITGLGALTPLATGISENWRSISEGRSAITVITDAKLRESGVNIAGQIHDFERHPMISLSDEKRLDSHAKFAVTAAMQINTDGLDGDRFGIITATSQGPVKTLYDAARTYQNSGPKKVNPGAVIYGGADSAAAYLSQKLGARGASHGLAATCASGTMALGEAMRIIRHGYLESILVVGADDCLSEINLAANHNIRSLARDFDDNPEGASRPFDMKASGFVMSQGAAAILLESEHSMREREATPLAQIVGYGATSDAFHATAPHPGGDQAARAMQLALKDASVATSQISYANLHGTSTWKGDEAEFLALKKVFGDEIPPATALKSYAGHLLGAAGVFETAMSVTAFQHAQLPPTRNIENNRFGLNFSVDEPLNLDAQFVIKNSFGFGGHNAVLVLSHTYT